MSERKYDDTGAGAGGGNRIYCTLDSKGGVFKINKEDIGAVLTGYLDNFEVVKDEGNAELKIAAGWKIRMTVSTKDEKRGTPDASGVPIASYTIEISMSSTMTLTSILNVICATDVSWDGYIRMAFYKPDGGDRHRMSVYTHRNNGPDNRPPLLRAFVNSDTEMFDGIPKALDTGITDDAGVAILDWRLPRNAWLEISQAFATKYGQTTFDIGPREAKKVYGKDGYWGVIPAATTVPAQSRAVAPATNVPSAQQAAPPADGPANPAALGMNPNASFKDKYLLSVKNKILACSTLEGLTNTLALMKEHKPTNMPWVEVKQFVNPLLMSIEALKTFAFDFESVSFVEVPVSTGGDDLPF
jgi:hypothetical protein